MPRQVYDFKDPRDLMAAAGELRKIMGTEGWNVLRQLAEDYLEPTLSDLRAKAAQEDFSLVVARAEGRSQGVRALLASAENLLKHASAAVTAVRAAEAVQDRRVPPGLGVPGRGVL